jgi:CubicO group peptidase (beta-lactamase class C family)
VLCATACSGAGSSVESGSLSELEIRDLLAHWVDHRHKSVGAVAGVMVGDECTVVGHGRLSTTDPRQPDGDTVFEIGSVTKVFTSTILADLVSRGELALGTPVQNLLDGDVLVPARDGARITLEHLATHSSGLPRMPDNFDPADDGNPYADYTEERLYAFLSSHELVRGVGEAVEYSNLGYGLMGHALAQGTGRDYETLVAQRILAPLNMPDTAITLTPSLQERLATGHDDSLDPVANWDFAALSGAGSLRSTVNDLLRFLEANLEPESSPLREAVRAAHTQRADMPEPNTGIGLGWIVHDGKHGRILWHNGGTGGYSSFIGFDPESRVGVVVLSNAAALVDYLGFRLLNRARDTQDERNKESA